MDMKQIKLLIFAALSLVVVSTLLNPLVFAVVIAIVAYPLYKRVLGLLGNKTVSSIITTIISFLVLIYPIVKILKTVSINSAQLSAVLNNAISTFGGVAGFGSSATSQALSEIIAQNLIVMIGGFVWSIPEILIEIFVMLALIFYFLRDGEQIKRYIYELARDEKQTGILNGIERLLRSVIIGDFFAALIVGIIAGVIFMLLGIPFAFILAMVVAIATLLPILGTWIVYIPLIIYYLLVGNMAMVGLMAGFGLILQLLEIYLAPTIAGERARMHPALMVLGFIGGAMALGVKGIIIGPIALGSLKIVLDHYNSKKK